MVFKRVGYEPINIMVDSLENEIEIPYTILAESGEFKIGVFGIAETETLPTLYSEDIKIRYGTDTHGTTPPQYEPNEIDQLRLSKQDKLTAGENITIDENKVISVDDDVLSGKIDKPENTPEVGKTLVIKSVNEDGTFICEWAEMTSGGAVDDVQINGESIVTDGVANIPLASNSKSGVVTGSNTGGIRVLANGTIVTQVAENVIIDNRTYPNQIISTQNLDYAVKAAMCDGKGAAWTEEEQASARKRIGVCDYELIDEFTLEEEVNTITRNLEPDGTPYNFKSMAILIYVPAHINADAMFSFDGKYLALVNSTLWSNVIKTTETYSSLVLKNIGTNLFELYKGSGDQWEYPGSTVALRHNKYSNSQGDEIRRFVFGANNSVNTLPVGTNIKIYGVRVNYESK